MPKKATTTTTPNPRRRQGALTTTRPTSATFVYVDHDHGDVELFSTFDKAVAHLVSKWDDPAFEISFDAEGHENEWHDQNGQASIYKRAVQ